MLMQNRNPAIYKPFPAIQAVKFDEATLVRRFAARIRALGPLAEAERALQEQVLREVRGVAQKLDMRAETGSAAGYVRRVLYEAPNCWSLAAIILRPGQRIHPHDHGGWGCAVTVQGVERNRLFAPDAEGELRLLEERDYPAGTGYIFSPTEVHGPEGADRSRVTVALHFLVHEG